MDVDCREARMGDGKVYGGQGGEREGLSLSASFPFISSSHNKVPFLLGWLPGFVGDVEGCRVQSAVQTQAGLIYASSS